MEYKNDKGEFISFIKAGLGDKENDHVDVCLKRVTKPVTEKFLNDRADLYKTDVDNDSELMEAFRRLAFICNEKEQECNKCPVRKYCNTYIENARRNVSDDSLKMIDLFCGAGGLSLGFTQEGFVTSLANDIQDCCVDTYAHNHPETPRDHIVLGDIKDVVKNLDELLAGRNVDIVVGGPPCQGFSMANRQRLIDDPRNYLYKSYVEVVKKVHPKFFVMENVKNSIKAGAAREGAGRKRELPAGARVTSFKLTDTERIAVKNFIAELRGGEKSKAKMLEAEREQQTDAIIEATVKPFAEELYKVINLYGGRGKGFRKGESVAKIISVMAFKDAVHKWENENPRD